MKFGMIITAMYPHETLHHCIQSIQQSTDITLTKFLLAEDGQNKEHLCEDIAKQYNLEYFKSPIQSYGYALTNIIDDVDIIIWSHSDAVYYSNLNWFQELKHAWEIASPKIGQLNLSMDGVRYDTLQLVYQWRSMNPNTLYGFSEDLHVWNRTGSPQMSKRLGRSSACCSIKSDFLKRHIPFDTDFDIEVNYQLLQDKMWAFWLNNKPIEHRMGYNGGRDTDFMSKDKDWTGPFLEDKRKFAKKYGIISENYLYHDLGGQKYLMREDIVGAANGGYLEEFDDLLDEIIEDLRSGNHPDYIKMYGLEHTI